MKKGDLVIGREYAICASKRDMSAGFAGLQNFGYGLTAFPFYAVRRIRIVAIDVPVEITRGMRSDIHDTKKMIQVEWLDTGIQTLDRSGSVESPTRMGRFVYHADARFLRDAQMIMGPWDEYAAEYARRSDEKRTEVERNDAANAQRDRVLAKLTEMGVGAKEGRGYGHIEIEASELERLLSMVAFDAADDASKAVS